VRANQAISATRFDDFNMLSISNALCHSDESRRDDGGICCRVLNHQADLQPSFWPARFDDFNMQSISNAFCHSDKSRSDAEESAVPVLNHRANPHSCVPCKGLGSRFQREKMGHPLVREPGERKTSGAPERRCFLRREERSGRTAHVRTPSNF